MMVKAYNFLWYWRFFLFGWGGTGLVLSLFIERVPELFAMDLVFFFSSLFLFYLGREDETD